METYLSCVLQLKSTFLKARTSAFDPGWLAYHQSEQDFQNVLRFLNLSHRFIAVNPNPCLGAHYFENDCSDHSTPGPGSCFLDLIFLTSSEKLFSYSGCSVCTQGGCLWRVRLKAWSVGHGPPSTSLSGSASHIRCIASELTANTWALLLNIYLQSPLHPI